MSNIDIQFYTTNDISSPDMARRFFHLLDEIGFLPDYIGYVQPVNVPFTFEKAIEYWSHEDEGCYDIVQNKMVGKFGMILTRYKKHRSFFMCTWWKWPNKKNVNNITISVSKNVFVKKQLSFINLFKSVVKDLGVVYAYIAHEDTIRRQYAPGRIENRLPGVFWYNYFGITYVNFFGKSNLTQSNWYSVEELNNGLVLVLDEHPFNKILENPSIEEAAKWSVGYDSFADHQKYIDDDEKKYEDIKRYMNTDHTQYKNVPDILA